MPKAMHYTYILKSQRTGRYYYGSTSDIETRLKTHNAGSVLSTRSGRPWALHYIDEYQSRSEAMHRERFFKKRSGNRWLKANGVILSQT